MENLEDFIKYDLRRGLLRGLWFYVAELCLVLGALPYAHAAEKYGI